MVRLFMNVGRQQRIKASDIIKSIAEKTGISGKAIGNINIFDKPAILLNILSHIINKAHSESLYFSMRNP